MIVLNYYNDLENVSIYDSTMLRLHKSKKCCLLPCKREIKAFITCIYNAISKKEFFFLERNLYHVIDTS